MKKISLLLILLALSVGSIYADTYTATLSEDTLGADTSGLWGKIDVTIRLEPKEGEKLLASMVLMGRARIVPKGTQIIYIPSAMEKIIRLESVKTLDDGKLWFISKKNMQTIRKTK